LTVKNGNEKQLTIFPNPAQQYITVLLPDGIDYFNIINPYGRVVKKIINSGQTSQKVNIQQLIPGTYYILAKGKNGNFTSKFSRE
jgi:hypothetical protein